MRLHWLRCRIKNSQFEIYWMKGDFNYADYYSKHHVVANHKQACPKHLVAKAATPHMKEKHFTSKKTSNDLILYSQQQLSTTRGVPLRHGLQIGRRSLQLVTDVLTRAPCQTLSYAACSMTSGEHLIVSCTGGLLVL